MDLVLAPAAFGVGARNGCGSGMGISALHIPDLWQARAVGALKAGRDVVVHAPTGAGKTFIFEQLYGTLKGQAVFTVPTRALANDKLAEWRARGWEVGLCTGDGVENPQARVIVATLETQKGRFLRREGPRLLVVDEYQMLGDAARGADYELALALAPRSTQFLLLSGSVANPQAVAEWLRRLGRDVDVISTFERPIPLDEADLQQLPAPRGEKNIRSYWGKFVGRALFNDLGPVLVFAPRRHAAEELARELAGALPPTDLLPLSSEQAALAGETLAKLLRRRIAFHHSGLSYAVRAGLIEPLAKSGQLRAVVATNGLAAGVNFSMRSVLVTDTRYHVRHLERHLLPEELLQMFGRAGRRGLDDAGWVLVAPGKPRLGDARPRSLKRPPTVDWPSLLALMHEAAKRGEDPLAAAAQLTQSLFSNTPVRLGFEHSVADEPRACGVRIDAERARLARPTSVEMLNSRGEWEPATEETEVPLLNARLLEQRPPNGVPHPVRIHPAIRDAAFWKARGFGRGSLCRLRDPLYYGREFALATRHPGGDVRLAPSLRAVFRTAKEAPTLPRDGRMPEEVIDDWIRPHVGALTGGGTFLGIVERANVLYVQADLSASPVKTRVDSHGVALVDPPLRKNHPAPCLGCVQRPTCEAADAGMNPALAWRKLGLIGPEGTPTRRGVIFSFFYHGEGLAVAAALEDPTYPIDDLIFDLANLRAGHRFVGEGENASGGRLGWHCARVYERMDHPGYLDSGVPSDYGDGASDVVRTLQREPARRGEFTSSLLRAGDLERVLIEWRSLVRQIAGAPDCEWERWRALQARAREITAGVRPTGATAFPALLPEQRRVWAHRGGWNA